MKATRKVDTETQIPKKTMVSDKIWWRNTGMNSFRGLNKQLIPPNGKFLASPNEIPVVFRDIIKPLEEIKEKGTPIIKPAKVLFTLQPHEETEKFNIVDGNGKVFSEKPMDKEIAEKLIDELSK
jgi:hypothetical protein